MNEDIVCVLKIVRLPIVHFAAIERLLVCCAIGYRINNNLLPIIFRPSVTGLELIEESSSSRVPSPESLLRLSVAPPMEDQNQPQK
jgi:hypothetical protein